MDKNNQHIIIVTGMSGAGRSSALKILEDFGYDVTDNLPTNLMNQLVESQIEENPNAKIAIGVDGRKSDFNADMLHQNVTILTEKNINCFLIFMDCEDDILINRFNSSRRLHPFARDATIEQAIARERGAMSSLIDHAHIVIDTSSMNAPELKQKLEGCILSPTQKQKIAIALHSFSYKKGIVKHADMIFDARLLQNPHYEDELQPLDGRDQHIVDFLKKDPLYQPFIDNIISLFTISLDRFAQQGRHQVNLSIGCTGGQHRSVAVAEELAKILPTLDALNNYEYECYIQHQTLDDSRHIDHVHEDKDTVPENANVNEKENIKDNIKESKSVLETPEIENPKSETLAHAQTEEGQTQEASTEQTQHDITESANVVTEDKEVNENNDIDNGVDNEDDIHHLDAESLIASISTDDSYVRSIDNILIKTRDDGKRPESYEKQIQLEASAVELAKLDEYPKSNRHIFCVNNDFADIFNNISHIFVSKKAFLLKSEIAREIADHVIQRFKHDYDALMTMADILRFYCPNMVTVYLYTDAVSLKTTSIHTRRALAQSLYDMRLYDEALEQINIIQQQRASNEPYPYHLHFNILMQLGRVYDSLIAFDPLFHTHYRRFSNISNTPRWRGEKLTDKTFTLVSGAGLGDIINMIGYGKKIAEQCASLNLVVPEELVNLFKNMPWVHKVYNINRSDQGFPQTDYFEHIFTLPAYFIQHKADINMQTPYVYTSKTADLHWKEIIEPNENMLLVGLIWHSNNEFMSNGFSAKSIDLRKFKGLINNRRIQFYSFQLGKNSLKNHPIGHEFHSVINLEDNIKTMEDTAAGMKMMDCMIGVDTGPIHLSGALDIKTFLLLNHNMSSRYFYPESISCWYPNMEIIYREPHQPWALAIDKLTDKLDVLINKKQTILQEKQEKERLVAEEQARLAAIEESKAQADEEEAKQYQALKDKIAMKTAALENAHQQNNDQIESVESNELSSEPVLTDMSKSSADILASFAALDAEMDNADGGDGGNVFDDADNETPANTEDTLPQEEESQSPSSDDVLASFAALDAEMDNADGGNNGGNVFDDVNNETQANTEDTAPKEEESQVQSSDDVLASFAALEAEMDEADSKEISKMVDEQNEKQQEIERQKPQPTEPTPAAPPTIRVVNLGDISQNNTEKPTDETKALPKQQPTMSVIQSSPQATISAQKPKIINLSDHDKKQDQPKPKIINLSQLNQ